jgi:hypothetical protein
MRSARTSRIAGLPSSRTENICSVIGGASAWVSLVPHQDGTLFITTDGSTFDTVLAVFVRSPVDGSLVQVENGCNNDNGTNLTSAVSITVSANATNFVLVDGRNGARGVLKLNYSLVTPSALTSLGLASTGGYGMRVNGFPGMRFSIERSDDLGAWNTLVITTSPTAVFDFTDTTATTNSSSHFYRALMIPY